MLLPWVSFLPGRYHIYIQFESDFLHIKVLGLGWLKRRLVRQFSQPVSVKLNHPSQGKGHHESWMNAFMALQTLLPEIAQRSAELYLVVGNSFVRFVTLPGQPNFASQEEMQSYLDDHFQRAYGESTALLYIHMKPTLLGRSTLVAAMPLGLIAAFRSIAIPNVRLASIVQAMFARISEGSEPTEDHWFIDTSRNTVTVGLWRGRQLQLVHTQLRQEFLNDPFRWYAQRKVERLDDCNLKGFPALQLITQPTLNDALKQWEIALTRLFMQKVMNNAAAIA